MGAYEYGIGDSTCDRQVNHVDFADWPSCMSGPGTADAAGTIDCNAFDANGDGDVDLSDFSVFQQVFDSP
jgi:hypothetical protein